jgi:predicted dienelactone hydrolase
LIDALRNDARWKDRIEWSRVALAGHSLGGYTVLGLAGGWASWKLPSIKAVLAMSPYCDPFLQKKRAARQPSEFR